MADRPARWAPRPLLPTGLWQEKASLTSCEVVRCSCHRRRAMTMSPHASERLRQGFQERVDRKRRQQAPLVDWAERICADRGMGELRGIYALRHTSGRPAAGIAFIIVSGTTGGAAMLAFARVIATAPEAFLVALVLTAAGMIAG